MKWMVRLLGSILALVATCALVVVLVLRTHSGTRWAIDRVSDLVPGELAIEQFEGTFWSGLRVPLAIFSNNDIELRVTELELTIAWSSATIGRIVLDELNAESINYRLEAPADQSPGPFELALAPLPLTIGVRNAYIASLSPIGTSDPIEIQRISVNNASVSGNEVSVDAFSASTLGVSVSVTDLESQLAGDVPVSGTFTWATTDDQWSGVGDINGSLVALQMSHALNGPYPASISGSIHLLNRVWPEFDVAVSWEQWSYEDFRFRDGQTRVRGTAGQYEIDYQVLVELFSNEQIVVTGTGTGNTTQLTTFAANLSHQAADVDVEGSVAWQPEFAANAQVHATSIDPSIAVDLLTGSLDADAYVVIDDEGNLRVENAIVTGTLNDAPVSSRGALIVSAERVRCEECLLNVGDNRLDIDGGFTGDALDLSLDIHAPAIDQLWPEIGGRIVAEGRFSGTRAQPDFTGELHGNQLQIADWFAEELVLNSHASSIDTYDLAVVVQQVSKNEVDFGSFNIDGESTAGNYLVNVAWKYRELDVSASGNAVRNGNVVTGSLTRARIIEQNSGTWLLDDVTGFEFEQGDFSVEPHSWSNAPGQLRVNRLSQSGEELGITARLTNWPLQTANVFLPPEFKLAGSAYADVDVTRNSGVWSGSVAWGQDDSVLNVDVDDNSTITIDIPVAELSAQLANGGAIVSARLNVEPGVTGNLDFEVQELTSDSPIQAEFRLSGADWSWIPAVVPTIDGFEGSISATLSASGPLSTPTFSGSLNWREGSLAIPALNVPISDIDLAIEGAANGSATLTGSGRAGDGDITVSGQFRDLMNPARSLSMEISGNGAELINWPEYRVWASPDIVITGNNQGWTFDGAINVPRAEIDIRELPEGAVTPSEDVKVVGRAAQEEPNRRITGDTTLVLGEDVHVQALGLDTKLRGDLAIRLQQDRAASAEGQITLVGGSFSAYGRNLTIDEGTLTFTGPLDNPLVDVRAIRIIESFDAPVTAGIHLRGRAQSLTSTVYSDPTMGEADALAYLVLGRPLEQASGAEGDQLSAAAIGLGVKQAARVTEQIGQTLGLDQLTLAGDGGDTTALVAGKQLNRRLHARYAYGVFSRLGTLLLRYQMTQRLTLEAGAGEEQSIDLLYLVEKQ